MPPVCFVYRSGEIRVRRRLIKNRFPEAPESCKGAFGLFDARALGNMGLSKFVDGPETLSS